MNLIKKYGIDIYIIMWCTYQLQGFLNIRGAVAQYLFVTLVALSLLITIYVVFTIKLSVYAKGLLSMLVLVALYGGYSMFTRKYIVTLNYNFYTGFAYLQMFLRSILPFFVFYLITLKCQLSNYTILRCFLYFFVTYSLGFYDLIFHNTWHAGELYGTFNIGYRIIGLIPMLFLLNLGRNTKIIVLVALMSLIIISSKRGAILTGMVLFFLYVRYTFKSLFVSSSKLIVTLILFIVLMAILYNFAADMFYQSAGMQSKFYKTLEGDTNGRDYIYSFFFKYILFKSSTLAFLFGNGADSTLEIFGQYAHNDWLEIGMNQGLLGIVVYVIYWSCFYKEWRSNNTKTNFDACIFSIMVAYFLVSLFSMSINDMPHCVTFSLALAITSKYKMKRKRYQIIKR